MVQNLQPGDVKNVVAGEIRGTLYVYRTSQGYDQPGNVGWQPAGQPLQVYSLAVGETVSFVIDGREGLLANGCPSTVQLLWEEAPVANATNVNAHTARQLLKGARVTRKQRPALTADVSNGDPASQAMQTLNAQWYNAVVTGCGLDPNTFQLVQGAAPLGTTSEQLWNVFDVVPPLSVSNYFNPAQNNVFSSDYGAVINNLIPQNSNSFQNDMGDYYSAWTAYLQAQTTLPAGGVLALFQTWSAIHMPPDQAQTCYTDYQQVSQGVIPTAVGMWVNAGGSTGKQHKAYNATIAQLQTQIASAPSKSVSVNSSTASSDITHTWAQAEASGFFDIFDGSGSSSYDQITTAMSQAGITINASFKHLVVFAAAPLSQPSTDPILSQYNPWYDSAALNMAYQTPDNTVWKHTHPTWDDTFGPTGNMLRTASALVVVDGITISMTSKVGFSSSQQTAFTAAASGGIWPFFEASGSGGWTNSTSFDAQGNVTVTSTCPAGNPNVLGVIVTPIGGVMML
ncbi:hypothetical protein GCM10027594_04360 [Hymenobacter agri]